MDWIELKNATYYTARPAAVTKVADGDLGRLPTAAVAPPLIRAVLINVSRMILPITAQVDTALHASF
jgi:hypothetical protein